MKRLGLIGGIGTLAGVNLVWRMVERLAEEGAHKDSDFPDFVYLNLPVRGTDPKGNTTFDTAQDILAGLERLNKMECGVALILCNTIHLHFNVFQKMFDGKLLNMVAIAARRAFGRVAVIESRVSSENHLYEAVLRQRGCGSIVLTEQEQCLVDELISDCMGLRNMDKASLRLIPLEFSLMERGAEHIIIGCTELSMIQSHLEKPNVIIDAGLAAIGEAMDLCR